MAFSEYMNFKEKYGKYWVCMGEPLQVCLVQYNAGTYCRGWLNGKFEAEAILNAIVFEISSKKVTKMEKSLNLW